MPKRLTGLTLLVAFFLTQCTMDQKADINKYFDIQKVIDEQVEKLATGEAQLIKTLTIDGNTESQTRMELDRGGWEEELSIFREYDINKPVLVDAYSIQDGTANNGHMLKTYQLIDDKSGGILNMKMEFDEEGAINTWESLYSEENILYSNLRNISVGFHASDGMINEYIVEGYHKLMLKDTVHYQLHALIQYQQ